MAFPDAIQRAGVSVSLALLICGALVTYMKGVRPGELLSSMTSMQVPGEKIEQWSGMNRRAPWAGQMSHVRRFEQINPKVAEALASDVAIDNTMPRPLVAHSWKWGSYDAFEKNERFPDKQAFGHRDVFGENTQFGERSHFGDRNSFGRGSVLGRRSEFGVADSFGNDVNLGAESVVGKGASFGRNDIIGKDTVFLPDSTFGKDDHFEAGVVFSGGDRFGAGDTFGPNIHFGPHTLFDGVEDFSQSDTFSQGTHFGRKEAGIGSSGQRILGPTIDSDVGQIEHLTSNLGRRAVARSNPKQWKWRDLKEVHGSSFAPKRVGLTQLRQELRSLQNSVDRRKV